jgi:hypothetical protein
MQNRTVLLITHRAAGIEYMDTVCTLPPCPPGPWQVNKLGASP